MGLTDKFKSFEPQTKVAQEDREYLDRFQKAYEKTLYAYKSTYNSLVALHQQIVKECGENACLFLATGDLGIPRKIDELQEKYYKRIYEYFKRKYSVDLAERIVYVSDCYRNTGNMKEIHHLDILDYNKVVDDIVAQLGGISFQDKAIQEIKHSLKSRCWNNYSGKWTIEIKGKKLIYKNGYFSQFYSRTTYRDAFLTGLIRFCIYKSTGECTKLPYEYNQNLYGFKFDYKDEYRIEEMNSEIHIGDQNLKLKFYKNNRLDVEFETPEKAREFACEWCGYTL